MLFLGEETKIWIKEQKILIDIIFLKYNNNWFKHHITLPLLLLAGGTEKVPPAAQP